MNHYEMPESNREKSTSFSQVRHASVQALLESVWALLTNAIDGRSVCESFARLGPDGLWAKMCQGYCQWTLDGSLEEFSQSWPRRGMMLAGTCSEPETWAHPIKESDCALWPTVTTCGNYNRQGLSKASGDGLATAVNWATPNTMDSLPPKSEKAMLHEATVSRPGRAAPANLRDQVSPNAVNWPTSAARDYRSGMPERIGRTAGAEGLNDAVIVWPTPKASDAERGTCPSEMKRRTPNLEATIKLWATPVANDGRNVTLPPSAGDRDSIPGNLIRLGVTGHLNPEWVECLMGYPIGYTNSDGLPDAARNNSNGNPLEPLKNQKDGLPE